LLADKQKLEAHQRIENTCTNVFEHAKVAEEHYKDLSSKPFYKDLVQYILSGPVVSMVGAWRPDGA
jgi:nucleoside diphosphate kinase